MSWVHQALQSFGASLNMEGLNFNAGGICILRDTDDTTIGIEDKGNALLIYVSRKVPFVHEHIMTKILTKTFYKATMAIPIGACTSKDGQFVLFSYITVSSGTPHYIYSTIKTLYKILYECVQENGGNE